MSEAEELRFPIHQDVCYTCRSRSGIADVAWGTTTYMSSGEVEFTTESALKQGQKLELAVDWPVLLQETCPMKIMIYGHVLQAGVNSATVKIERYEFRTGSLRNDYLRPRTASNSGNRSNRQAG